MTNPDNLADSQLWQTAYNLDVLHRIANMKFVRRGQMVYVPTEHCEQS